MTKTKRQMGACRSWIWIDRAVLGILDGLDPALVKEYLNLCLRADARQTCAGEVSEALLQTGLVYQDDGLLVLAACPTSPDPYSQGQPTRPTRPEQPSRPTSQVPVRPEQPARKRRVNLHSIPTSSRASGMEAISTILKELGAI